MSWHIQKYDPSRQNQWDRLVSQSINGVFIFYRDYMDYHARRFTDFSLMFFYGENLFGVLPAHRQGNTLISHNGLTFGGIVKNRNSSPEKYRKFWKILLEFLQENKIKTLIIKSLPWFYYPWLTAYEDWLYKPYTTQTQTKFHWLIDTRKPPSVLLNADRRKQFKKKPVPIIQQSNDWESFWSILEKNLNTKHQAKPVHTLDEMKSLAGNFPGQIRLITAKIEGETVAGAVLYDYEHVLHFQYLSALPDPTLRHAVDYLTAQIIRNNYDRYAYINLGSAQIPGENGRENPGLIYWKFSHGAEPFPQYTYRIDVENLEKTL